MPDSNYTLNLLDPTVAELTDDGDGIDTISLNGDLPGISLLRLDWVTSGGTATAAGGRWDQGGGDLRTVIIRGQIENATGSVGQDEIHGNGARNTLYGDGFSIGFGATDTLFGKGGADTLFGWGGNDLLFGGAGADRLIGGPGQDEMTGGRGADVFAVPGQPTGGLGPWGRDKVLDFRAAQGDRIDLSDLDGNTDVEGDQDFIFVTGAFTGAAAEVRLRDRDGFFLLQADLDGDRSADFAVQVFAPTLSAADIDL